MKYVLAILIFSAAVTVWGLAVVHWQKFKGGCGACSHLDQQSRQPPVQPTIGGKPIGQHKPSPDSGNEA